MADEHTPWIHFDDGESCLRWEASLTDLLDGTISPEDEAALRSHATGCPHCGDLLREAQSGREWVQMLHDAPPSVPADLLGKILARTAAEAWSDGSGVVPLDATPLGVGPDALVLPQAAPWMVPGMMHGQRQARILMTAAMAFFSIALTLSLTGVRLTDLHSGAIQATASRQFFDTKKQVVSFYDNLRLVREMEATVEDMRHTADNAAQKNHPPRNPQPSARRDADMITAPLLASQVLPAILAEKRDRL